MKYVFLFPGQGSQKVGMGKDLYDTFQTARKRFDEAKEVLGRDICSLIFSGPEEDLKATQNTQPALFIVEAALTDVLKEKGITPVYTLGHSLGEYSALYAAGVYSFADGLRLVAKRGELMAKAGASSKGTMAAIIGLSKETIAGALAEITDGIVVPANENAPDQIVISGEVAAVDRACEKLTKIGAKRAIKLPVGGAFHSPLMKPAADEFKVFIETVSFNLATCPVITNVTAQPESAPEKIKDLLIKQLLSPVHWIDSIETLRQKNAGTCLEVGPGNVLKGLVQKCCAGMNAISCSTVDNIYSLTT